MQIHILPIGYRNEALIKKRKVGRAIKVETNVHGAWNFVRVRVILDVRKPLARFVTISRAGQREFYQVKYEKLQKFCGACGFMGHIHLECGSGEHKEDKLKWGDFLKADLDTWHGRGIGGTCGGGRSGYQGRGRETPMAGRSDLGCRRGVHTSWRFNALPPPIGDAVVEREVDDTALALLRTRTWR
jgi:hypothetical protein